MQCLCVAASMGLTVVAMLHQHHKCIQAAGILKHNRLPGCAKGSLRTHKHHDVARGFLQRRNGIGTKQTKRDTIRVTLACGHCVAAQ